MQKKGKESKARHPRQVRSTSACRVGLAKASNKGKCLTNPLEFAQSNRPQAADQGRRAAALGSARSNQTFQNRGAYVRSPSLSLHKYSNEVARTMLQRRWKAMTGGPWRLFGLRGLQVQTKRIHRKSVMKVLAMCVEPVL